MRAEAALRITLPPDAVPVLRAELRPEVLRQVAARELRPKLLAARKAARKARLKPARARGLQGAAAPVQAPEKARQVKAEPRRAQPAEVAPEKAQPVNQRPAEAQPVEAVPGKVVAALEEAVLEEAALRKVVLGGPEPPKVVALRVAREKVEPQVVALAEPLRGAAQKKGAAKEPRSEGYGDQGRRGRW
ncbi:MAG TPA: hypothetical protein VD966_05025 [Pyrinomonadaceae bacterium]|nr:hypothetical protein [Pyrinomonadaceae bacterium]